MIMQSASGAGRVRRSMLAEPPSRKADARTLRRVARAFRPYYKQMLIVLAAIIFVSALGVVNPYMLKLSISVGFFQRRFDLLVLFAAVMVVTPVVSSLIGVGQTYLNTVIGQRVMRDLRNQL